MTSDLSFETLPALIAKMRDDIKQKDAEIEGLEAEVVELMAINEAVKKELRDSRAKVEQRAAENSATSVRQLVLELQIESKKDEMKAGITSLQRDYARKQLLLTRAALAR